MNTTVTSQPIDLAHLDRQTGGNDVLARDVLRLFLDGSVGDLARLKAASRAERREVAHLILGSARSIGAGAVATAAAAVEAGGDDLAALEAAVGEARRFIAAYLGP